jgi:NAD(P)-dependent dehydrogenase (short-subunit alcohol dehydrogenase family)
MRFQDKVAIVTGGANGLGRDFAVALAREGCHVLVSDFDESAGVKTAEEIGKEGDTRSIFQKTDVTAKHDVVQMVERAIKDFGQIDILINSAGGSMGVPRAPVDEIEDKDWDRVISLNLTGTFLCTKAVVPFMKQRKQGKIVNLSSITARIGGELTPVQYVTSKGAISTFTRHVAQELGPYGINVNAVAPGIILSGARLEKMWYERKTDEERQAYVERIPLRRLGKVSEITGAVMFLCSQESAYITGITLDVNGGLFSV